MIRLKETGEELVWIEGMVDECSALRPKNANGDDRMFALITDREVTVFLNGFPEDGWDVQANRSDLRRDPVEFCLLALTRFGVAEVLDAP